MGDFKQQRPGGCEPPSRESNTFQPDRTSFDGGIQLSPFEVSSYYAARLPQLKQGGAKWRCPCPLHRGKTDSFEVDLATGRWVCWSKCGQLRGDVFDLESRLHGGNFAQAKAEVFRIIGRVATDASGTCRRRDSSQEVERYTYTDLNGNLVYYVVRYEDGTGGKTFRQCRPDGHGGFVWNLNGIERVPYRLPRLAFAQRVYLVEGEKDVHTLEAWGLVASCNSGGAGNSNHYKQWGEYFRDLEVVILPDNDSPGRKHALAVAEALLPVASAVYVVELPGLPEKGDVTDWKDGGGTIQQFLALCDQAPRLTEQAIDSLGKRWGLDDPPADYGELWPEPMSPEARYGVLGDWLSKIEPHTEADSAALLVQALVCIGNVIGRGPHFRAEGNEHHPVLFAVIVGQTSKGRKGTSESRVRQLLASVDPEWSTRARSGLSTGEGIIFEVRDPQPDARPPDAGEKDKRLLVTEPELARVLSVSERQGNTLSATLRQLWDCPHLLSPMTKTNRCSATDPHVSIIGHITKEELRKLLSQTAAVNGFGNRFLWVASRRSKLLPEGGLDVSVEDTSQRIAAAVRKARSVKEIRRDAAASALWNQLYGDLTRGHPGLLGAVTSRAESQVMRLALIYALLDCQEVIGVQHLTAALAVWDYCERSARFIFGDSTGDSTADRILRELRQAPAGLSRTQIASLFQGNKPSPEIGRALGLLVDYGLAEPRREPTAGRAAEIWTCTK
jgi:hypothetical protein